MEVPVREAQDRDAVVVAATYSDVTQAGAPVVQVEMAHQVLMVVDLLQV
jgi:hypothetical protein